MRTTINMRENIDGGCESQETFVLSWRGPGSHPIFRRIRSRVREKWEVQYVDWDSLACVRASDGSDCDTTGIARAAHVDGQGALSRCAPNAWRVIATAPDRKDDRRGSRKGDGRGV